MMTPSILTGQTHSHLAPLCQGGGGGHRLQPDAVTAWRKMRQAAGKAGFNLYPASSFRDFDRQLAIWNGKFRGQRPLLDNDSRPLASQSLTVEARCHAILRWSALPGASRHHWGSDLDVYDADLLPPGARLALEPWEYAPGGYFAPLADWLAEHMAAFGFYRPYAQDRGGVAAEPWHLSYRPLAKEAERLLTPEVLLAAWKGRDVAGADWLIPRLPALFDRYIANVDKE